MRPTIPFHPLVLTLLLATAVAQAGQAGMSPQSSESRFSELALCVAALERDVKSGLHANPTAQERKQWQLRLESAFAHTGKAYLDGLSGDESKAVLHAAETTVASWPEPRLKPYAQSCHEQGLVLLKQAPGLQQLIVRNSARRLLNRELAKLAVPAVQ